MSAAYSCHDADFYEIIIAGYGGTAWTCARPDREHASLKGGWKTPGDGALHLTRGRATTEAELHALEEEEATAKSQLEQKLELVGAVEEAGEPADWMGSL